jgi:hypothetical protein
MSEVLNEHQLAALKATMPWTERVTTTPQGGRLQIVNAQGYEVPLFDMSRFLVTITHKIANEAKKEPAPTA